MSNKNRLIIFDTTLRDGEQRDEMKIQVKGIPSFSFDTIQTAEDVLIEMNWISGFTRKITEKNLKEGLDRFKSESSKVKK